VSELVTEKNIQKITFLEKFEFVGLKTKNAGLSSELRKALFMTFSVKNAKRAKKALIVCF